MNKTKISISILMAGLMAAAGAQAQSTSAAGSSDGPPKAGEASNQTLGAPNAMTTNSPVSEAPVSTKDAIRQDAQGRNAAAATTLAPGRAGEATTTVQGQPNANPNDPRLGMTRAEARTEKEMRRAQIAADRTQQVMGNAGYGDARGTPANAPAGSLSVFQGGTPD